MTAEVRGGNEMRMVLQVGSELGIKSNGDVVIDTPELEVAADARAADAVLMYRLDSQSGEHVLRLVELVAERRTRSQHGA
jgi:hypothetical protein